MTYISNTITDSNSPSVMCTALEGALTTEGYTLVDTVVISTRTHRIWKNPAVNNSLNADWYIDIAYTTTGVGTFGIYVMEHFDPATDLAYRMAYTTMYASALTLANSFSPFGATGYALENANWYLRAAATGTYTSTRDVTLPATSFGYWISVTPTRIAAMYSVTPATLFYSGIYEQSSENAAIAGAVSFPIVSAALSGNPGAYDVALTRYPRVTSSLPNFYLICQSNISNYMSVFGSPSVPGGVTEASNRFALRIPIHSATTPAARWGWFIDVAVVAADATVTRGDTLTDGSSNVWILTSRTSTASIMMKRV